MMQDEPKSLEVVAEDFGRSTLYQYDKRNLLRGTTVVMDGYGSIARPMSEELARRGVSHFVLTDPKSYLPESVQSQCTAEEIGKLKVDVGEERLRELGAEVTSFARDIHSVPEGVVASDAIVITTVDNRRADIVSNRRAARMSARLIKVNVEPVFEVAAVRAYDFRQETRICVECQFSNHQYAAQHHPKSCDGSFDGRHTNSPRWLSQAAAQLGVMAALDLASESRASESRASESASAEYMGSAQSAAKEWLAHDWQYFPRSGVAHSSRLEPKINCRWEHARRWQNVIRLSHDADSISLRELIQSADIAIDARTEIRFCQQVALRARCRNCRTDHAIVRWFADLQASVGTCPSCNGPLLAMPFAVFSATSLEPLMAVLDQPLNQWGVERFAVIEFSRHDRCTTFVVCGC